MLPAGAPAPDFTIQTLRGADVSLGALRGTPVWLAFFRFAACPLCNFRVHSMVERWGRFQGRDFRTLAIFQSSPDRLEEFVAKQAPEFDLVADPEMRLYGLYDLGTSWLAAMKPRAIATLPKARKAGFRSGPVDGPANRVPGDYLIDRRGSIAQVYEGRSIADHIPLDMVEAFLDAEGA